MTGMVCGFQPQQPEMYLVQLHGATALPVYFRLRPGGCDKDVHSGQCRP